jgi:putative serine protease PepD
MTQTTNNENDHGYAWARRPGSSSDTTPAPAADATAEFVPPGGSQRTEHPESAGPVARQDQPDQQSGPPSPPPGWPHAYQAPSSTAEPVPSYPGSYPGSGSPSAGYPGSSSNAGYPGGGSSGAGYPGGAPSSTQTWPQGGTFGHTSAAGSGGLPPVLPVTGRRQRRPGWGGVLAVGAGAAALSSLLTAGIVLQTQDPVTANVANTSSTPSVKAPVTSSSTSSPDWGKVSAAVMPSVVAVQVSGQSGSGEGSGVILDKTGRIVTNNHVVSGTGAGSTVRVVLSDGRNYAATVVGTDPSTDLAVIKLTDPPTNLVPAVLGNSSEVAVGDPVMAVGNPLGLAGTVTTGIVSATDRPTTTTAASADPTAAAGETVVTNAIQTDAAVNPGNSGGALVDAQGRVIGIPSSIASLSTGSSLGGESSQSGSIGLGFAIPIDEVKDVSSQLIKGGSVSHAWLGVGPDDGTATADGATRDAAVLKEILSGGPAEKAGLKVNDAVIAVDGEPVNSALSLVGQLRERQTGADVTLTVVRGGKTIDVKVTLGTKPASQN